MPFWMAEFSDGMAVSVNRYLLRTNNQCSECIVLCCGGCFHWASIRRKFSRGIPECIKSVMDDHVIANRAN